LEPLGFIAGALAGACTWELTSSIRGRRSKLAPRLEALERCVAQHDTELEEISGMLSHEESRLNELADEIETINIAQGKTFQAFEERLQNMQAFIVQAAQQASERRVAEASAPVMQGLEPERTAELNELMRKQRQAQEEFAARRRNQAAVNFRQPAGGGL
jgi:DNA repair exonuclease SbcCD ATPase subunit